MNNASLRNLLATTSDNLLALRKEMQRRKEHGQADDVLSAQLLINKLWPESAGPEVAS